jgi:DNA polymerase elongation subunit (family B)
MDFLKNLWKTQPNTVMGFGALLILIVFFNAVLIEQRPSPEVKKQIQKDTVDAIVKKMNFQEEVKYMKACGAQLRVDRVNWYLDEKGIKDNFERIKVIETTDLYSSSKPYELMESYKARGRKPKTGRDLPYVSCVPSDKDKVPEDFLRRMGY